MQKNLIITLLFSILIALFAILNAAAIPVNLIFSKVEISAALVILIAAALGALLIYSIDMINKLKMNKRIKQLEKELDAVKRSFEMAQTALATCEAKHLANASEMKKAEIQVDSDK